MLTAVRTFFIRQTWIMADANLKEDRVSERDGNINLQRKSQPVHYLMFKKIIDPMSDKCCYSLTRL